MALIAWYPLNGDLEDYSINGNHTTGSINVNSSGKIGKTYDFSSHNLPIKNPIEKDVFSVAVWVKYKTTDNQCIFCSRTVMGSGISLFNLGGSFRFDAGGQWSVGGYAIPTNTWIHVVFVKDKTEKRIYINGSLHSKISTTSPIIETYSQGTIGASQVSMGGLGNYLNGNLNDLRFYDEALSLKEIKEIAKAKILHYDFNQFAESTENLLPSSALNFGAWYGYSGSTATLTQNQPLHQANTTKATRIITSGGTSTLKFFYAWGVGNSGEKFSTSVKIYNRGTTPVRFTGNQLGGNTTVQPSEYKICYCTGTSNASGSIQLRFETVSASDNIDVIVFEPTLERKDHSTEYTSNQRIDRVTDCSGFRNHSQPLGLITTPQWTSDSKMGSGCYKFNSNSNITTKQLFFDNRNQEWTVSGWAKLNVNDKTQSVNNFNLSNRLTHSTTKKALLYLNDGVEDSYVYSATQMPVNEWYHFAFVANTSNLTCKYYHNGVLNASSSNYTSVDFPQGFSSSTVFGSELNGYLDDVRVYATALSDADVKELYESKGSVCKNGKLMVNEIVESVNYAHKMNDAIKAKSFSNGLTYYTQSNCQITLTDDGFRIYRPPNKNPSADGNTMWGGMKFQFPDGTFTKGRKYRMSLKAKGQTSNAIGQPYLTPQMGWCAGGLSDSYSVSSKNIPANFNSSSYQEFSAIFDLKNFNVYQTATKTESIFTAGVTYNCCRDLAWGFSYTDTGSLGTDLYIKDLQLIDITDGESSSINKKGQLDTVEINEVDTLSLPTKTELGADWIRLFYHNNKSGTVLFSSDKREFLRCNTGDKISDLWMLEQFRGQDGKFELMLKYQSGGASYNRWKQTSNFTSEPIAGYEAIQCSWTSANWGGLAPSSTESSTIVDGSPSAGTWYYAIGSKVNYTESSITGIPKWSGAETGWVEVWVRCDNPQTFKLYKNGNARATEFIEI